MTATGNVQCCSQSVEEAFLIASTNESRFILETPPPDVVASISRYFDDTLASNEQTNGDNLRHVITDCTRSSADSDSGDSFFITQHPLPEAVRSVRRHQSKCRPGPRCSREQLADGEEDGSSSPHIKSTSTPGKSCKAGRGWYTRKCTLKKYSFPFLERDYQNKQHRIRRKSSRAMKTKKHVALVRSAVGGFLKCVEALEKGSSSLLACIDDGDVSSLSELEEDDDEDDDDDDDIRVVETELFTSLIQEQDRQAWYTPPCRSTDNIAASTQLAASKQLNGLNSSTGGSLTGSHVHQEKKKKATENFRRSSSRKTKCSIKTTGTVNIHKANEKKKKKKKATAKPQRSTCRNTRFFSVKTTGTGNIHKAIENTPHPDSGEIEENVLAPNEMQRTYFDYLALQNVKDGRRDHVEIPQEHRPKERHDKPLEASDLTSVRTNIEGEVDAAPHCETVQKKGEEEGVSTADAGHVEATGVVVSQWATAEQAGALPGGGTMEPREKKRKKKRRRAASPSHEDDGVGPEEGRGPSSPSVEDVEPRGTKRRTKDKPAHTSLEEIPGKDTAVVEEPLTESTYDTVARSAGAVSLKKVRDPALRGDAAAKGLDQESVPQVTGRGDDVSTLDVDTAEEHLEQDPAGPSPDTLLGSASEFCDTGSQKKKRKKRKRRNTDGEVEAPAGTEEWDGENREHDEAHEIPRTQKNKSKGSLAGVHEDTAATQETEGTEIPTHKQKVLPREKEKRTKPSTQVDPLDRRQRDADVSHNPSMSVHESTLKEDEGKKSHDLRTESEQTTISKERKRKKEHVHNEAGEEKEVEDAVISTGTTPSCVVESLREERSMRKKKKKRRKDSVSADGTEGHRGDVVSEGTCDILPVMHPVLSQTDETILPDSKTDEKKKPKYKRRLHNPNQDFFVT
ncbi:phoenix isoform X2 [Osmerus eperlanus]|uniref:phoenix isoform X2 n=1 Tax=Osmerus eperlanus TaxID=29151 RepID=UPI002E15A3C4